MIPGSGRLSEHERELVARVHRAVVIEPGTIMLKVLRPGSIERYLRHEISPGVWGQAPPFDHRLVGGTVVRKQDCGRLRTPADFVHALRLDYPLSPFHPGLPMLHTMEFPAMDPAQYVTPLGAPSQPYPEDGFPPDHAEVELVAAAMAQAAERAGVNPNTVRREVRPWPFTGTGLTADADGGVPERWRRFGPIPAGAAIVEYPQAKPVAVYRGEAFGWAVTR
ncbi:hypothetical protein [Amycolatopsis pithecellobii]|uniref:Uncharacterized protein n=1 Tax=Amycolatopsis pithecellobii TaxID=664692 RepID=A0A6N7Z6X3_9PSEU|nr:hypothetical protein [Amycolatopsis pithecellobii]MTD57779.1 hypothetical protein [Amycolatopsis pithecellobii]